jgi:2-polyprenyl-3-methyl-5-hydroxy-6-metoxy-1,4-benzoquinol methylase
MNDYTYVGSELDLFAGALRWKEYLYRQIAPFLGADVLEVGAGIGGTTKILCRKEHARWICLEPDRQLAERLFLALDAGELPACCQALVGTLDAVRQLPPFDTLLYIDVLEHIEDDRGEMARVGRHLAPGGHLVVLSPAHPFLYTPFDRAIGHFRRYTRRTLADLNPPSLELSRLRYLDSAGMLASLGNRLLLKQSLPTPTQIAFWDNWLVPLSIALDPIARFRLGKSVLGVWRKPPGEASVAPCVPPPRSETNG